MRDGPAFLTPYGHPIVVAKGRGGQMQTSFNRARDAIADKVLAYKPKPKSEAAKKRKKTKRKLEKAGA